jgi:hypothetical protein
VEKNTLVNNRTLFSMSAALAFVMLAFSFIASSAGSSLFFAVLALASISLSTWIVGEEEKRRQHERLWRGVPIGGVGRCYVCVNSAPVYRRVWLGCLSKVSRTDILCRHCWDGIHLWFYGDRTRKLFNVAMGHIGSDRRSQLWNNAQGAESIEMVLTLFEKAGRGRQT